MKFKRGPRLSRSKTGNNQQKFQCLESIRAMGSVEYLPFSPRLTAGLEYLRTLSLAVVDVRSIHDADLEVQMGR